MEEKLMSFNVSFFDKSIDISSRFTSSFLVFCFLIVFSPIAFSKELRVPLYYTTNDGMGEKVGSVLIQETAYGLLFTPELTGLKNITPGLHGFHIHENPACEKNGTAAGGHLDPKKTNQHLGPYQDNGHLGDLPALYVSSEGKAEVPVFAPRIKKIEEINNRSLMVHVHGDNFSDHPEKLGGGGPRMLCGVIKEGS